MSDELVTLIAEEIYRNLVDSGYIKLIPSYKNYLELPQQVKDTLEHVAHNVITVFDDYYDGEYDIEEEEFDDENDDDLESFDWPKE